MEIPVNFLTYQSNLRIKKSKGVRYIFCTIRRKFLVIQPEEIVRQLVLEYLIENLKYKRNHIQVERGLNVNGLKRRADIIVFNADISPFLLVECKAPTVNINQKAFEQIANYNLTLKVNYLLVTNGIQTYCCSMNYREKTYQFLDEIPMLKERK